MYCGGVYRHSEAENPFTADMQPPGLRLPRSPPQGVILPATQQYTLEAFVVLEAFLVCCNFRRQVLTFTDIPQATEIFASRLHGFGFLGQTPPWNTMQAATMALDTPIRIPVKQHPGHNLDYRVYNHPPDIPEIGQGRHARDSNNARALNTRHTSEYLQETELVCASRPLDLCETSLSPQLAVA